MTTKEIDPSKGATPAYRPLPQIPKEAPVTAIAKGALKASPRVRHPSLHKLAARLSADLTMPNTPDELTSQISLLIAKADDPAQSELRLNQARELLDEMFVKSFFSDKDYEKTSTSTKRDGSSCCCTKSKRAMPGSLMLSRALAIVACLKASTCSGFA